MSDSPLRIRSRVIGCLRDGFVTVILGPGVGMLDGGITTDIPVEAIPPDLRMPNSEFLVHFDDESQQYVVERLLPPRH